MKPLKVQRRKLKRAKNKISERLIDQKNRLEQRDNTCLFLIDEHGTRCLEESVNCHAIPEAEVLKGRLRGEGQAKVGVFRLSVDQWREVLMRDEVDVSSSWGPLVLPTGKATAASFACGDHDREFSVVDVADPDTDDPRSVFMLAYRSVLYVAHQVRQAARASNDPDLLRGCRQKSLLQTITARSWQMAKYDAVLLA